jgi:transposase-like protein
MRERKESGLTIKAYCEQVGLHENTYYYWQRKLRQTVCEHLIEQAESPETTSIVPQRFMEVRLQQEISTDTVHQLHIEAAGVQITTDSAYPVDRLAALLRAMSTG